MFQLGTKNAYVDPLNKATMCLDIFLTRFSDEGDELLNKIVSSDETCVCHVYPDSKQQSMDWGQNCVNTKIMSIVFSDRVIYSLNSFPEVTSV